MDVTKSTATVYLSVPEYTDDSAFSKTHQKHTTDLNLHPAGSPPTGSRTRVMCF
jgi:hypothetical protein